MKIAATNLIAVVFAVFTGIATTYAQGQNAQAYPPGPNGQAGTNSTSNVVVTNSAAQPVPTTVTNTVPAVIANSTAQPVPTKNAADPVFQAFQMKVSINLLVGQDATSVNIPVPAGKRLVIETVSGFFSTLNANGTIPQLSISTYTTSDGEFFLPVTWFGHFAVQGWEDYAVTSSARLYADSKGVGVFLRRSADANYVNTGEVNGAVTVSGYLVDIQ